MNPKDKFFIVSSPDGRLNVRSAVKVEKGNDLGDFDLINGDVIHAVGVEVSSGGVTFHRFDRIYRNGTRYDPPSMDFQSMWRPPPVNTGSPKRQARMHSWQKRITPSHLPGSQTPHVKQ